MPVMLDAMEEKLRRATTNADSDKFIVRLPDGMRTRIAEAATANNRTMNAEVIARLNKSFEQEKAAGEAIERMNDTLAQLTLEFARFSEKLDAPEPAKKAPAKKRVR